MGKTSESLRRKAIGPFKWQPVALIFLHCRSWVAAMHFFVYEIRKYIWKDRKWFSL